jgi:hypothetical protein
VAPSPVTRSCRIHQPPLGEVRPTADVSSPSPKALVTFPLLYRDCIRSIHSTARFRHGDLRSTQADGRTARASLELGVEMCRCRRVAVAVAVGVPGCWSSPAGAREKPNGNRPKSTSISVLREVPWVGKVGKSWSNLNWDHTAYPTYLRHSPGPGRTRQLRRPLWARRTTPNNCRRKDGCDVDPLPSVGAPSMPGTALARRASADLRPPSKNDPAVHQHQTKTPISWLPCRLTQT